MELRCIEIDYEKDTKFAYNTSKAKSYKRQQTKELTWTRFTTWREKAFVLESLRICGLTKAGRILDIPCGTGILGRVFCNYSSVVIAADISRDMMTLAAEDYKGTNLGGFVQADITRTPFRKETFGCVVTIGLMHRLPQNIRVQVLKEIVSLSNRFVIISYSVDSPFQRMKQRLITAIKPSHKPAPLPVHLRDIISELNANGLVLKKRFAVMPFLSAEVVLLLEKIH